MELGFTAEQENLRGEFRKLVAGAPPRAFVDCAGAATSGVARSGDATSGVATSSVATSSVARYDTALWSRLGELGWLGTAIAERHGGSGLGEVALCILAEEVGRAMAAVPFTASVCGFTVGLLHAGSAALQDEWLPRVANGSAIGVLLDTDGWSAPPQLENSEGCVLLSGTALNVLDGGSAIVALACVGAGEAARLVLIDLAHATRIDHAAGPLDLLHATASFEFDRAPVDVLAAGSEALSRWSAILDRYALFVAFEQLGGAEGALDMARAHSVSRYAFGRPIGAFQAVKHLLADAYVAIDLARSNCFYGAAALAMTPAVLREAAAVARISATEAFRRCARANIHVHGALGVTWESDCQLYYRRAQALATTPGSLKFWKERLIGTLRETLPSARAAGKSGIEHVLAEPAG
ncbi:MAG TPA: acyl-CoA dehydrogenase family protein [Burkholderiaceae bacterium]|nr:acyl-CoA dehydrogenase family protein [Burkholderiaceae bacterium]